MGRLSTAFRAFFRTLSDNQVATRIDQILSGQALPAPESSETKSKPVIPTPQPVSKTPLQSEALTLLATLQREARLVDFLMEDLSAYADEQIGAAVREVQRESAQVLTRLFAIQPILTEAEGSSLELPSDFDAGRFRLTGKVTSSGPHRGTVQHHGWEATRCELPSYTGTASSAKTVAPAEVEIG